MISHSEATCQSCELIGVLQNACQVYRASLRNAIGLEDMVVGIRLVIVAIGMTTHIRQPFRNQMFWQALRDADNDLDDWRCNFVGTEVGVSRAGNWRVSRKRAIKRSRVGRGVQRLDDGSSKAYETVSSPAMPAEKKEVRERKSCEEGENGPCMEWSQKPCECIQYARSGWWWRTTRRSLTSALALNGGGHR